MSESVEPPNPTVGPWSKKFGFVSLRIDPVGDPEERQQFRIINDAQGGRVLGTLRLDTDELKFLTDRLLSNQVGVETSYQSWLQARLSNPGRYVINGRRLDSYDINQQINYLNAFWRSGKPVPLA